MTRIDKNLNLVIPLESDTHGNLFVHSTPISRALYKTHYRVFAKTYSQMLIDGVTAGAGPAVARLALESVSREMGQSERDPEGIWPQVQREVMNEIVRLTNVAIASKDGGYESLPLATAYARGIFDEEDRDHIEGKLVFFLLETSLHPKDQALGMLNFIGGMWGLQTTALSFTDYLNSLPKSTQAVSSGATPEAQTAPPVARLASVPR
jgi:hypothetical protein